MKKHILVTGGAGFIGSHLVDVLVQRGHDVTVLDIKTKEERAGLNAQARVLEADLLKPETMEMVRLLKPDVIYHLAANASVAKSVEDPIMDTAINYQATVRLLDVAADIGVERFIFASTGGALSNEYTQLPTPEDAEVKPLSPYAVHKLAAEKMGEFYRLSRGLPFVALRFANVYGPGQTVTRGEANVIATFAHRMVRNEPVAINGTGRQTRDYLYVDDIIAACLTVLDTPNITGIFNVGSGIECDILTVYRVMAAHAKYDLLPQMRPAQLGEAMRSCLETTKITKQLGWKMQVPFAEGIARTLDWHADQLRQTQKIPSIQVATATN